MFNAKDLRDAGSALIATADEIEKLSCQVDYLTHRLESEVVELNRKAEIQDKFIKALRELVIAYDEENGRLW